MTTFVQYPERFIKYLAVEKNCSELTCTSYRKDLASFAAFLEQRTQKQVVWEQVGALDIRAYLAYLNCENYAKRTIARRISALRSFYKFLVRENILQVSPLTKVRSPKLDKR